MSVVSGLYPEGLPRVQGHAPATPGVPALASSSPEVWQSWAQLAVAVALVAQPQAPGLLWLMHRQSDELLQVAKVPLWTA